LTLDEKLELIQEHQDGRSLNACLTALGVSKGTWHYRMRGGSKQADREARDEALKPRVVKVVEAHPDYGYRRMKPDLEAEAGEAVNHKRLRRLLNQWDLALHRTVVWPKPSQVVRILRQAKGHLNLAAGMDPSPLELLSTDFTEIPFDGGNRKAHLIAMVDVASEWVPGWAVGLSKDTTVALECWREVVEAYGILSRDVAGIVVHSDQDPVFTGYDWLRALAVDSGVRISYSERGAWDNPWIESFWSRFKTENRDLFPDAKDLVDLRGLIDGQMRYYNGSRRHSSVGNRPPLAYLKSEGIGPRNLSAD
jgi:putative transposase